MLQNRLTPQLIGLINDTDWTDPAFSLKKAFVCCHLSALAYENIPEWELKGNGRFKIVPSENYQRLILSGDVEDLADYSKRIEFGEVFTVYRRYALVTGIVKGDNVFLAIRGTASAYDWFINLNARKVRLGWQNEFYHRGFFKAIMTCMDEVKTEINKRSNSRNRCLIVTGHSLGGAMAAIFRRHYHQPYAENLAQTYTFGMPRYGNMNAVALSSPFHLYNELDIVPRLPPLFFGYENSLNEHRLDGRSIENTTDHKCVALYRWLSASAGFLPIQHHYIERYLARMELLLPAPDDD